jgi:uncharacterized membrane protein
MTTIGIIRLGEALPISCPQCGIQMPDHTAFCPGCGWDTRRPVLGKTGGIPDNIAAAMGYLTFVPAVVFLVAAPFKKNRFIRFHAFQSILLTLTAVLAGLALKLVFLVLSLIRLGHLLLLLISAIVLLGCAILWLVLIVKALQGDLFKLPLIGDLAERQAGKV